MDKRVHRKKRCSKFPFFQYADGYSPRDDESDDDDEADLSMDEVSTMGKVPEDKMGLEMDCPSDAGDGTRIIPLGDYIIIFSKVQCNVLVFNKLNLGFRADNYASEFE